MHDEESGKIAHDLWEAFQEQDRIFLGLLHNPDQTLQTCRDAIVKMHNIVIRHSFESATATLLDELVNTDASKVRERLTERMRDHFRDYFGELPPLHIDE